MAHVSRGRRKGCEYNEKDSSPEWKRSNPTLRHIDPYFHHVIGASSSLQISDGSLFETKTWSCKEVIWGYKEESNDFHVRQFLFGLCRPLSEQLHASHHHSHDTSLDAHLVICWLLQEIFLNYFLCSLQFDAHVRNIANLDFSIYWSFMISAGLELPADLLSIVGLELLGR